MKDVTTGQLNRIANWNTLIFALLLALLNVRLVPTVYGFSAAFVMSIALFIGVYRNEPFDFIIFGTAMVLQIILLLGYMVLVIFMPPVAIVALALWGIWRWAVSQ